ncbi:MAG: translocation/assembly module TamB domain-containing protein [Pseudomonadota bacterium]
MKRLFKWLTVGAVALLVLIGAALWFADTSIGHRLIADQITTQTTKSGLSVKVGRIEGSIFGKAQLRAVRLYDPEGLFFEAPAVDLDWSPFRWINNSLDIKHLHSDFATLYKQPKLKPSASDGPILPTFDIHIGALSIDRLRIEPPVTGVRRSGKLSGSADIVAGRAKVQLAANTDAGDVLTLRLDAEPDRDRFDLQADIEAPARGVIGALAGITQPFDAAISGNGAWRAWAGKLAANAGGAPVADLALTANAGTFGLDGRLALATLTKGRLQKLTAPIVRVTGQATLKNRRLDSNLKLGSAALAVTAEGMIDLGTSRFDALNIDAKLLQSEALFTNMRGGPLTLKARLDGPFATAKFDYLLTANSLIFGTTGFENARASGQGRLSRSPVTVPARFTATRVTGVGNVAGGILANLLVTGDLKVTSKAITSDALKLTSDKLSSRLTLLVDLKTGRYDVGFAGELERYTIPGLGIVDVRTNLKFMPGLGGEGIILAGRGQAWVRRLDNKFLASLTQGLPQIETGLVRGADGILRFNNLRLTAPGITLTGNGIRRADGTFQFEASGRQARYGPIVRLLLDGPIQRPRLDIIFKSPNAAMGLNDVRLLLDPNATGYAWTARGGSTLGGFTGAGSILLPAGAPATVNVAALDVSGIKARGSLISREGGFDGTLTLAGSGIGGTLNFAPAGNIQRVEAHLKARDARLSGPPLMFAQRGQLDGVMLLDPVGTTIEGTLSGQGLSRSGLSLARLAANVKLRGGTGEVRASFAGSRGRSFDIQSVAQVSAGRVELIGSGSIDRKPVKLISPALLMREAGGWRLSPTTLEFAGGRILTAGLFGTRTTEFDASVTRMPLTILDVAYPQLGLGGSASGAMSYRVVNGGLPDGKANIRISGLTRSGLVLTSKPLDLGIAAVLSANNAAARAVAVSGGQTIGRGQIKLSPTAGPDLITRLNRAPMFAQLRFNGAADTLWRLAGVEALDLSGPVAIGADISGTLDDPRIAGSLRTNGARIESAVTGMVLTGVKASGRFGGSTLTIDQFTAASGKDGKLSGSGTFNLSSASGFAMNLNVVADQAKLIARDELAATVTGPLSLKSDINGGLISGDIILDKSSYRLGRAASAVAAISQLNVTEINTNVGAPVRRAGPTGWQLAIKARAPGRVSVTGLGIESEWRARLEIGGSVNAPVIRGQADLVRGGYEFAGRRFDLARGVIRFQGESPPDPILDIVANGDTQGLNATIRVTGTGQRPEIAFSSTPALPQDELLSRLLFGTSITNLSAPEAVQLASAVASLQGGGNGLNPINALRNAIGLDRLRILPADTTTGQRTSIAAGKYLTRKLYFEVITDGQGYSATRAEFQITRWLSLLSTISSIGRQSATVRVSKDY